MDTIRTLHLAGIGLLIPGTALLFLSGAVVPALVALVLTAIVGFSLTDWQEGSPEASA